MAVYDFQLILPDLDDDVIDGIYGYCGDVGIGTREGITYADVHREADSLGDAIDSVMSDLETFGIKPLEVHVGALASS
jgi:hypothetical protein